MDYMHFYSQRLQHAKYGAEKNLTFVEQAKRFFMPKKEGVEDKNKNFKRYAMWGAGTLAIGGVGLFIYRKRKSSSPATQQLPQTFEEVVFPPVQEIQVEQTVSTAPPQGFESLLSQLTESETTQPVGNGATPSHISSAGGDAVSGPWLEPWKAQMLNTAAGFEDKMDAASKAGDEDRRRRVAQYERADLEVKAKMAKMEEKFKHPYQRRMEEKKKGSKSNVPFQDLSGGQGFTFGDLGMAPIAIQE